MQKNAIPAFFAVYGGSMQTEKREEYRQALLSFVMGHTQDVLKQPRSFIRYPFMDPSMTAMYGTGTHFGPYTVF